MQQVTKIDSHNGDLTQVDDEWVSMHLQQRCDAIISMAMCAQHSNPRDFPSFRESIWENYFGMIEELTRQVKYLAGRMEGQN